jgi:hypothetical protein
LFCVLLAYFFVKLSLMRETIGPKFLLSLKVGNMTEYLFLTPIVKG